ncbi:MAG: fused MFS/spermidine synthase [Chloroflexota bacterium]
MNNASQKPLLPLLALVFFGGFANLATEIIGPRMFASMYGTATSIWAIIISVTLVGLSAGYALGGRITQEDAPSVMPIILLANAAWLLVLSWVVWMIPASGGGASFTTITTTATLAFFPPSTLFGMLTPMSITILSQDRAPEQVSPIVGNLYAISTIGSVLGALTAAYFWIPWVGLSLSLRLFALGLIAFAVYFYQGRRALVAATAVIALFFPQPSWSWAWTEAEDLDLVAQEEGYYQTVRVYTDGTHMQMHLGPTFHSKINIETGEPVYSYAENLLAMADEYSPDMTDLEVLIIGGAGNALANAFEDRGANVTVVEIDPVVINLSDAHFEPINGEVVTEDGRVYTENAPDNTFDIIILDAFDGGAGVPGQLSTVEYYEETVRVLKPEGIFLYNFIGSPQGRLSGSYDATSATLAAAFADGGARFTRDDPNDRQNVIFAGSPQDTRLSDLEPLLEDGWVLTDDRNPIEVLNGQSRNGVYFRR